MESSIAKLATATRTTIYALIVISLISSSFLWFMATLITPSWIEPSFPVEVTLPISIERALWGFLPAMLPVLQFAMIFVTIAKLFSLYANQIIFELDNAKLIKRVGILLLLTPGFTVLSDFLLSITLTYGNGEWNANIHPSDHDVTSFITGLVVLCVSKVMELAARNNEESKLTI